jgi:hypothetical protein
VNPILPAGPALAAAVVLFVLPGLVFLASLRGEDRARLRLDEAAFLVVAPSVALSAWVALVLGEMGRFSTVRAALVVGTSCLGAAAVAALRGRLRGGWPEWPGVRALAPALAVLLAALALQTRPSEYLMGGRDPGTYVAGMALIARTGGIAYVDPVVLSIPREDVGLFYRTPESGEPAWGRFMGMPLESPETARVVPEFFHLFPAFGAYLFESMGVRGALAAPCVFGVLGTLAVLLAWRRVYGTPVALLAALLLAINVIQVWFARYPVAEPMSQFLLFLALWAFVLWEEHGSAAFGLLAGAAFGLGLLVRLDNALVAVPLGLYLLVRRAHGALPWSRARPVVLPVLLLAGHAVFHATFWSRKYVLSVVRRPYWQQPAWVWVVGLAVVVAALLAVHRLEPRLVRGMEDRGPRLRRAVIASAVVLALYAYFLRPLLSAWAGADGNTSPALAHRGWLLALGFHRLAAHDAQSLVRLGWFVTWIVLVLALAGFVLLVRRWEGRWLLPTLLGTTYALFYLYKIRIYNDYYFAMRRFMPVTIPWVLALAALALVALWRRGPGGRFASGVLTAAVAALFLRDTLPLLRYRDWNNSVRFVDDLARRFGPQDVVIFEQPRSVHLLSLPLWAVYGVNALELARFNPDPAHLQHLAQSWRGRYRNMYFVHTYSTDLCGLFLQRVEDLSFGTYEWERSYLWKPRGPEPRAFRFRISRVVAPEDLSVPPLREIDVGGSDDVQVSGFFDKEGGGDHTFRWTGSCASLYLPGARAGDEVTFTASTGERPVGVPVPVTVTIGGQGAGHFEAGGEWTEHTVRLPDPLPPGPPVLRLDVPTFRPANVGLAKDDARDLGVMLDRVRLGEGGSGRNATIPVSRAAGGSP